MTSASPLAGRRSGGGAQGGKVCDSSLLVPQGMGPNRAGRGSWGPEEPVGRGRGVPTQALRLAWGVALSSTRSCPTALFPEDPLGSTALPQVLGAWSLTPGRQGLRTPRHSRAAGLESPALLRGLLSSGMLWK